jgi:hypothetical protein
MKYDWKSVSDRYYYYDTVTGKIVGMASKIALQEVFFGIVYTGQYTFTLNDEKHLGQYISIEHAKTAIEVFWDIQYKTLLEN